MRKYAIAVLCVALAACGGGKDDNGNDDGNGNGGGNVTGPCAKTLKTGDDITVDTTWSNTGSACDYLIDGIVDVTSGTLTVEPGVVVQFTQDSALYFSDDGTIVAKGTSDKHIKFQGVTDVKGFAIGLNFNQPNQEAVFDWVDFRNFGKTNPGGLEPGGAVGGNRGAGFHFTNCTVEKSKLAGLNLELMPVVEWKNNAFNDNDGPGLRIDGQLLPLLDDASDYLGKNTPNGDPWIDIDTVGSVTVSADLTLRPLNAPYHVTIDMTIDNGTTTLQPGVTFLFQDGASLTVEDGAVLQANGTADQRITFKGESSSVTWDNLKVYNSEANISYADFSDAAVGVDVVGSFEASTVTINHTDFHNCGVGVCVDSTSNLSGTDVSIDPPGVLQGDSDDIDGPC